MKILSLVAALIFMAFDAGAVNTFNVDANGNVSATSLNTTNLSAGSAAVSGTFTATGGLVNVGNVSATGNLSVTTINGSVPVFSGSPSWYVITNIPTVLQNISNTTGSVSITTLTASALVSAPYLLASKSVSWTDGSYINSTAGLMKSQAAGSRFDNVDGADWYLGSPAARMNLLNSGADCAGAAGVICLGGIVSLTTLNVTGLVRVTSNTAGLAGTISATNSYALSVSGSTGTFGSIGAGPLTASGLMTAQAGLTVTGAVTATTTIQSGGLLTASAGVNVTGAVTATTTLQAATVSATTGLYAKAISVTNLALLGTVSTTGVVSTTGTFSQVVHEGVVNQDATSSPTTLNLGTASLVSGSITTNTTVAFSGSIPTTAQVVLWKVTQDGTGGRVITWPANARFSGNTAPTVTTTANTNTLFTLAPLPGSANILVTMPATGVSN